MMILYVATLLSLGIGWHAGHVHEAAQMAVSDRARPDWATTPAAHAQVMADVGSQERGITIRSITHSPASSSSNSHLLLGRTDAILVDVPMVRSDAEALISYVRDTGRQLVLIFITHAHPDHYLSLDRFVAAFPQAKVVSTQGVSSRLHEVGPEMVEGIRGYLGDEAADRFVPVAAMTDSRLELEGTKIAIREFQGGEDRVSAALHLPELRALIAGDVVYSRAHLYLGDRDHETWLAQIAQLEAWDLETLYPGHGPPTGPSVLAEMRQYISDFVEAVSGGDAEEALGIMKDKYPEYVAVGLLEQFSVPAYVTGDTD